MKTPHKPSRRIPEEKAASLDEVEAAVDALTKVEIRKLEQYARRRVKGLGRACKGRNYEDLLQEAVTAICNGDRRWNQEAVSFFDLIVGAIRSISSHWREQFDTEEAFLECELTTVTPEGEELNPMLEVGVPVQDGRRITDANYYVEHIEHLIAARPLAALIVDGMKDGLTGPEIRETLELTQTQYETEMKWLRRTVRTDAKGETRHAG